MGISRSRITLQPTVVAIFVLFVVHAALAARKIPSQLRERKRILALAKGLNRSGREKVATRTEHSPFRPHVESMLWIWQVRTGLVMLVLGSLPGAHGHGYPYAGLR